MSKKIVVLYHDDNDGYGSGYVAWRKFKDEAEYHPVQYKYPIPSFEIDSGTDIYILDFSFNRKLLNEWESKAKSLTVIDHHKTAYEELKDLKNYVFDNSHSGAVLTWKYFYPDEPVPHVLHLIEDYDLYNFNIKETRAFDAGLSHHPGVKSFLFWDNLINNTEIFEDVLTRGEIIHESNVDRIISFIRSGKVKEVIFRGNKVAIFNMPTGIDLYHELIQRNLTLDYTMSYFINNNSDIIFSFRSDKKKPNPFDVGEIAKSMGGGGHLTSAGVSVSIDEGVKILKELYE